MSVKVLHTNLRRPGVTTRSIFLLLLLLLCTYLLQAQPYYFRHYQVENGLSNNTINCSAQDKKGFLWLGTKEGLNRFDGYRFKLFTLEDTATHALTRDLIYCLFVDPKGTLWVGSQKGLYRYDEGKERLVKFIEGLPEIKTITMDRSGQLWFISDVTVCRYNFEGNRVTVFPARRFFAATTLCMSADGDMWFASLDGRIHRYDSSRGRFDPYSIFDHSPPITSCWVNRMLPSGPHSLFIGTFCQGVKEFDTQTGRYTDVLTYNPEKTTIFVHDIIRYSEREFWFATESGIFILDNERREFQHLRKQAMDPYSISDNAVYTLCKDLEGGVWAGTFFGGVNYYARPYTPFRKYYPNYQSNAISGNAVREICEDRYGQLWIGTEDAGLNRLDPATGHITQFKPTGSASSVAYYNIHGLLADGDDLWIGTHEHGLDVMDIRTGKVKRHYVAGDRPGQLHNNFVLCLLKSSDGQLFVGGGTTLYQYFAAGDRFEQCPEIPGGMIVSALLEDRQHTIWVTTFDHGVFYFNRRTGARGQFLNDPADPYSLPINTLNAICEDQRGDIWFATEGGGLCRLTPGSNRFIRYTTKEGLPSNYIFKVLEDDNHTLWLGTSKGLVHFNPDGNQVTVYTKANGLLNDQFNYSSGYKDRRGQLYFGSTKGMVSFHPDQFIPNNFHPPVYITGFQVDNKELTVRKDSQLLSKSIICTKEIVLPYDQSSFSLDFAALSYTSPEVTAYRYMMEGLDKEWTTIASNRKVYFTKLSPGDYTFRVQAAVNGFWPAEDRSLRIKILPPFWRTTWAYLLYTLLVLAICYLLVRNYHRRTQIKKEKEIYEAKIDFFTNVAHEIRTPLTLIKGPLENLLEHVPTTPDIEEDVLMMERNTNRLMALITQILDFRQTEIKGFRLDLAQVNINEILQGTFINFTPLAKKRSLQYEIELPAEPLYAAADEDALQKIISNLLSNAVKYSTGAVKVVLYPALSGTPHFVIECWSDGNQIPAEMAEKIFEPFFRLKETIRQKGTGIGLALARSLALLHKGELYLRTDAPEGWNVFVLTIPMEATGVRLSSPDVTSLYDHP
ncbi:histidine kinase [Chitinophaga pendula]|uniref:sensor histidine kinase n=1 Tax=Chitinophaga TaxID=79328 RepID=UPI0012FE249F|nr:MULTISPECIES: sensor histidine kinase [Chitinophaga]UCJ08937.1 histidine kinase [Chitinophaga pendula]